MMIQKNLDKSRGEHTVLKTKFGVDAKFEVLNCFSLDLSEVEPVQTMY